MPMAYALFCNDAKLSKAYPTEADVWKLARQSGLVVDAVSEHGEPVPQPILDNDYEIRSSRIRMRTPCKTAPTPNARLSATRSSVHVENRPDASVWPIIEAMAASRCTSRSCGGLFSSRVGRASPIVGASNDTPLDKNGTNLGLLARHSGRFCTVHF
jgi:hypothetical protein